MSVGDPERNPSGKSLTPDETTQRECMAWVYSLRGDPAESRVATYASYLLGSTTT